VAEREPISMVGLIGGQWFGTAAGDALERATAIVGDRRHLDSIPAVLDAKRVAMPSSPAEALDLVAKLAGDGASVCIVVSGDPGFFGLGRLAGARFGSAVAFHPAPSSVSLAFARAGTNWDDAVVISAHGRPLDETIANVVAARKAAVLTSPEQPPQMLGRTLIDSGCPERDVLVVSRIGETGETGEAVFRGNLATLAAGAFDGLSVVVLTAPGPRDDAVRALSWGLPEDLFEHRDGMITKAEVRAVALGKLALTPTGVFWDVGAGSGSVAAECCRLAPGLRVFAVERRPDDAERIRRNLAGTGASIVEGEAPAALAELPDPDRVFVGGGGAEVLEEVLRRLRPGGRVVAAYAAVERAAAAAQRLGNLVQVSVSRGVPATPGGPLRLQAENPVFVCWGPS